MATLSKKNGDGVRVTWAKLLKRVFDVDVETCGVYEGKVKIIAAIKEVKVIKKILDHIGRPSVLPEIASARGPPEFAYDDNFSHDNNLFFSVNLPIDQSTRDKIGHKLINRGFLPDIVRKIIFEKNLIFL